MGRRFAPLELDERERAELTVAGVAAEHGTRLGASSPDRAGLCRRRAE
jgi:hypothetical protein